MSLRIILSKPRQNLFPLVLCLLIFSNWLILAKRSFWIDEALTYVLLNNNLPWPTLSSLAFYLTKYLYPAPPLYFVLEWLVVKIAGTSEMVMRFPSICFMILTALCMYKLSKYFFTRTNAFLATIVFLSMEQIVYGAVNARQYALGIFLVVSSLLFLARWMDEGGKKNYLAFIATAGLIMFAHPLFAPAILMHMAYFIFNRAKSPSATWRKFLGAIGLVSLLDLPLLVLLVNVWKLRAIISPAGKPIFGDLINLFLFSFPVSGFALVCLAGSTYWLVRWVKTGREKEKLIYILLAGIGVYFLPFSIFFLLTHLIYLISRRGSLPKAGWNDSIIYSLIFFLIVILQFNRDFPFISEFMSNIFSSAVLDQIRFSFLYTGRTLAVVLAPLAAFTAIRAKKGRIYWGHQMPVIVFWIVTQPLIIYLIGRYTNAGIFLNRYCLPFLIGLSLLTVKLLGGVLRIAVLRKAVVAFIVLTSIVYSHGTYRMNLGEYWREAADLINKIVKDFRTPVILHCGFIESDDLGYLNDPKLNPQLMAALEYYPVKGPVWILPIDFVNPQLAEYLDRIKKRIELYDRPFLFIKKVNDYNETWFTSRLDYKFHPKSIWKKRNLEIVFYKKI